MALETEILRSYSGLLCPLAPDLIQKREQARLSKDWAAADQARVELAEKGIVVIDTINGPVWKRTTDIE